MKLITAQIERRLEKFPIRSQDGKGKEAEVIVKFFNSFGAGTWLVTEGEKLENGDWEFFGYCKIHEWEWGYFRLSDLARIRGIEREIYDSLAGKTVKELAQ